MSNKCQLTCPSLVFLKGHLTVLHTLVVKLIHKYYIYIYIYTWKYGHVRSFHVNCAFRKSNNMEGLFCTFKEIQRAICMKCSVEVVMADSPLPLCYF